MADSESNVKRPVKSGNSIKKPKSSTENDWQKNVLCSHELPFPSNAPNIDGDEQKSFLSQGVNIGQSIGMEDQQIPPLYQPLVNPTHVSMYPNDTTMLGHYGYGYEPPAALQNIIIDDSHGFPNVPSENNSYYNEERIGGEDSGVGEDLTYQFDASLTLEQVPSLPENQPCSTPGVYWTSSGQRPITPAITSPYSPPPYSHTSWAEAPEFVPKNSKSPSVTMNSHNATIPPSSKVCSKTNEVELYYPNSSNHEEQEALSEHECHSVMPHFIENSYNMPQITMLMPSNTTVISGVKTDIYNTGISFGVTNQNHGTNPEHGTNYFPNVHQQSLMTTSKQEMPYDGPHFQQFHPARNAKHKEMPPPPPPPMQNAIDESFDNKSSPPKAKTWAQVVNSSFSSDSHKSTPGTYKTIEKAIIPSSIADAESQLCPFSLVGECRYGEHCAYVHGLICDLCGTPSLHPNHEEQRKRHQEECMNQHESDMELAFAHARSKDKICGICMEVVMEKPKPDNRFGILPNCAHCYCLKCIRTWRKEKQFQQKIIRACPECRQTSDYICPSIYWVDTKEEKDKLLNDYRIELKKKECKYYNKGNGECPFGNKCFYRHEDQNGKIVDVGPPSAQAINNSRLTSGAPSADDPADADFVLTNMARVILYDFFEERNGRLTMDDDEDILEILDFLSDVEELDDSDE